MNCNRYLQIRIDISESSFLRRRNYLVSERDYHTTKFFTELLLAIDMKKKKKKNRNTFEQTCVFRIFNTKIK